MTNFFITLTMNCNLECKYCYGEACDCFYDLEDDITVDYNVPENISYKIEDLILFLKKDPNANIIFYGGEPLIEKNILSLYINKLPAKNMLLHTNGILLNEINSEDINKIHTISISIDGDE